MVRVLSLLLMLLLACIPASAKDRPPHASLKGSKRAQQEQNTRADRDKLTRIADMAMLKRFKSARLLVPLPESNQVRVDLRLDIWWRWCRPWTRTFLEDLGGAYFARFRQALQVNSAIRTIEYQRSLGKRNGNAAKALGPRASLHPTGAAIDLAKKPMSEEQIRWMQSYLLRLEERGLIDATEEHHQAVFHIMVFKSYGSIKKG